MDFVKENYLMLPLTIFQYTLMQSIPRVLDFSHFRSSQQQQWRGVLDQVALSRLAAVVVEKSVFGVEVVFAVRVGESGEFFLQLEVTGALELLCQRCLLPFSWELRLNSEAIVVFPGASAVFSGEDREVIELGNESLFMVLDFIEDEILLEIPFSPRHLQCGGLPVGDRVDSGSCREEKESPFAVLRSLREKS